MTGVGLRQMSQKLEHNLDLLFLEHNCWNSPFLFCSPLVSPAVSLLGSSFLVFFPGSSHSVEGKVFRSQLYNKTHWRQAPMREFQ
jgi:hypothetical protein